MELFDIGLLVIAAVGFISLSKAFLRFIWWAWKMFFRPQKNLKDYGSWAVITGSTDGIGKAIAFELASKGLNLVLVGRNPTKLTETENEIHKRHNTRGVEIIKMVIDFVKSSRDDITRTVEEGTKGLDVGILINNAGVGYPYARFLHEVDKELMDSLVKVNIEGPTLVTKAVLPSMVKKKKGAIVNIGSGSSAVVSAFPLYSVYAATKAYLAAFSRSISSEYEQLGIDIQCQFPLLVATKMAKIKSSSLLVPSAEVYSKASVRFIGYECECTPYWSHSVQWCILQALPAMVANFYVLQYFLGVRRKGLLRDSMKQQN